MSGIKGSKLELKNIDNLFFFLLFRNKTLPTKKFNKRKKIRN